MSLFRLIFIFALLRPIPDRAQTIQMSSKTARVTGFYRISKSMVADWARFWQNWVLIRQITVVVTIWDVGRRRIL